MGCGCVGPSNKDKYSIENIISTKYDSKKEITSRLPLTEYVKKVFQLINKVRTTPSEFISVIEQAEKYIKEKNGRKIFEGNGLKISLNEGKAMFKDCVEYLKTLNPMNELQFCCDDIVLECPTEEKQIKDINIFREKVLEKRDKCGILAYFKDSICIPEISVLLMIVDDSIKNPRKKRETLLNPNYKFIGISSSDGNNIINVNENVNLINSVNKNEDNNNGNNIGENINENQINKNSNNKIMKSEIKHKAFCAYFTLK